jgi:hypothetical protein
MEYTPSTYATSLVMGGRVITGHMLGENDEIIGYLPVYLFPNSDPLQAFAVTHRVISHYLDQENIQYIRENHLMDTIRTYLDQVMDKLQRINRQEESNIWQHAYDQIVDRYPEIHDFDFPQNPDILHIRERVRRWMQHRPHPDGRYEGFQANFNDPRGAVARHTVTGEEFIFSPHEILRD